MAESLNSSAALDLGGSAKQTYLSVVPFDESIKRREQRILPPVQDKTGRVTDPAIDIDNLTLANGQPVESFYARGDKTRMEVHWATMRRIGQATRAAFELSS